VEKTAESPHQAAMMALVPASNIRVVDPALASSIPSDPMPFRDIPFSALAGGCFGVRFALVAREGEAQKTGGTF